MNIYNLLVADDRNNVGGAELMVLLQLYTNVGIDVGRFGGGL